MVMGRPEIGDGAKRGFNCGEGDLKNFDDFLKERHNEDRLG